jgi:hypothetical protein
VAIHDNNKDIRTANTLQRLELISVCSTAAFRVKRRMRTCH